MPSQIRYDPNYPHPVGSVGAPGPSYEQRQQEKRAAQIAERERIAAEEAAQIAAIRQHIEQATADERAAVASTGATLAAAARELREARAQLAAHLATDAADVAAWGRTRADLQAQIDGYAHAHQRAQEAHSAAEQALEAAQRAVWEQGTRSARQAHEQAVETGNAKIIASQEAHQALIAEQHQRAAEAKELLRLWQSAGEAL